MTMSPDPSPGEGAVRPVSVSLSEGTIAALKACTGKRGMSAYVEALIQRRLERERLRELIEEAFWAPPAQTPYGPVLSLDDVIGTKVRALADRGAALMSGSVSLAVIEAGQVDQLDGGVVLGEVAQFVGEARAAEAVQTGRLGRGAALGEQSTDVPEAFQVPDPHHVVPLRLADAEQRFTTVVGLAKDGDVDFVTVDHVDAPLVRRARRPRGPSW